MAGNPPAGKVVVRFLGPDGNPTAPETVDKVVKPDSEWQRLLTPEQYRVTRGKGTEPAFCGGLLREKEAGIYKCVNWGLPLFSSATKSVLRYRRWRRGSFFSGFGGFVSFSFFTSLSGLNSWWSSMSSESRFITLPLTVSDG